MPAAPHKGSGTILTDVTPTTSTPISTGKGTAVFVSDDYDGGRIRFRFATDGGICYPPEPKIQTVDLMGGISRTQWVGQEPYRMDIGVQLDGFPNESVEDDIKTLEHFAEVHAGRSEPPIVTLDGAVPKPHPNLTWRVARIADPTIDFVEGGRERCRYFTVVSLVQRVTDQVLVELLKSKQKSTGIKTRTITVRAGEDWLYDVARRGYGDPSRASDIAVANNLHLGKKLTQGTVLRLP